MTLAASQSMIAWVAGRSDPATCRLSPQRVAFLNRIALPGWKTLQLNFPYARELNQPLRRTHLLWASFHNAWQFLADTWGLRRQANRGAWRSVLQSREKLLLIANSCGLQLLLDSRIDCGENVFVIALGPVGWRRPQCPHLLIQGENDYLSRLFYRRHVAVIAGQGHLNYDQNPATFALAHDWICSNILK